MIDFNKILKIYNELDQELSRLKNISHLNNNGYFESLLSDIDWHIYFLYRIKDKNYFAYFLLTENFWKEIISQNIIKNNEIKLKPYDYKKGFKLFDKLKLFNNFKTYFENYKTEQIIRITNKQEILSFLQTISILHKLKEYKPSLEIDFFDFDTDDYENFSKSGFSTEKSIVSEYLRKSAIYDFNFEKFYLLKKEELDKKILLAKENKDSLSKLYHDLGILNTYNRFYKLYDSLVNLSYSKIVLLKIINFGNIFDENKKYLLPLLTFHFSKNKQEARKINFIFKNHFVEFIILISILLILLFGNISIFSIALLFIVIFVIIVKLLVYFIDNFNFNLFNKIIFSIIILSYAIFSVFTNPLTLSFIKALPEKGVINIVFQDKQIKKENIEKEIKEKIYEITKKLNDIDLQTNITNK